MPINILDHWVTVVAGKPALANAEAGKLLPASASIPLQPRWNT
jgi:hypothetical protein